MDFQSNSESFTNKKFPLFTDEVTVDLDVLDREDFIDLPSTFRDKSVQSAVPNYFKNCKVPIICYKYNKPIRSAISNFNKVVSDLDTETCTADS